MSNNITFDDSDIEEDRRSTYGVDSDDESLIDVDSPADGYFVRRDLPQETFVENPVRVSEDKAREAAEERQLPRSVPSTAQPQSVAASRQPVGFDESAPLLDAGPAPPDYYQATGGRGEPPPQAFARDHARNTSYGSISSPPPSRGQEQPRDSIDDRGTFQNPVPFSGDHPLVRNGLFNEQGVLSSRGQEPASMRDPAPTSAQPQQYPAPAPPVAVQDEPRATRPSIESTTNRTSVDRDEESGQDPSPPYHDDQNIHHHYHHHSLDFKKKKRWRRFCYCCCFPRIGWPNILLIIALIALLVMFLSGDSDSGYNDNPHSKLPVGGTNPPTHKLPLPDHEDTRQCTYNSDSAYESFDFRDPGNFTFLEMIDSSSFSSLSPAGARLGGTIRISPFSKSSSTPNSADVAIRIWVHAAATSPWTIESLRAVRDEDGFELGFPDVRIDDDKLSYGIQGWERPCLDFAVLIQVQRDVKIQNWDLTTAHLDVEVESGLFVEPEDWYQLSDADQGTEDEQQDGFALTNDSSIYAIKGNVHAAYWNSRRTKIETTSGAISGTYALRDSLEVKSGSGSIDVGVEPKEAAKSDPKDAAADLLVKSHSGSLNIECPARHDETQGMIPVRRYNTRIETQSSSIDGRYLLGESTTFKSHSGSLDVYVLPVTTNAWNQTLYTSTTSSTTSLNLLEALTAIPFATGAGSVNPDPPYQSRWLMGAIHSVHKSNSGSIDLKYPWHWSGMMDGRSVSGSMSVQGKGVEIIRDDRLPGKRILKAKKGIGNSTMVFKTTSSSVDVQFEDGP